MRGEWNPTCAWVGAQWLRCQHASEEQAKPAAPRCMERCQCIILWSVMNDVEPSFLSSKIITCHQFMMTVCSPTFGLMDNPEGVVANGASSSEGVVWNWGCGTPGDRQIIVFFKKNQLDSRTKKANGDVQAPLALLPFWEALDPLIFHFGVSPSVLQWTNLYSQRDSLLLDPALVVDIPWCFMNPASLRKNVKK